MLFFSAIKQARRRARSEHRPKDWMRSADRVGQKLSICVEKPQCARRFQACAPQTCGFISSSEMAYQCARPSPTQPRPKEWLGSHDGAHQNLSNLVEKLHVEKHVQGTLSRLRRILSAARAARPPANPPGARPPLGLPARPPEPRAHARARIPCGGRARVARPAARPAARWFCLLLESAHQRTAHRRACPLPRAGVRALACSAPPRPTPPCAPRW